jgi:putative ubiquitin-RnfH superfamily antitoxin RatB of RatAB toxin-antitoxin module
MANAELLRIEVAYVPPGRPADVVQLELSPGATILHALRASGMLTRHAGIDLATQKVGVWGRVKPLGEPLRDQDRVEIYRPLTVDPKEARRLRYRDHRERKTSR